MGGKIVFRWASTGRARSGSPPQPCPMLPERLQRQGVLPSLVRCRRVAATFPQQLHTDRTAGAPTSAKTPRWLTRKLGGTRAYSP